MSQSRLPLRAGVGLRDAHFQTIIDAHCEKGASTADSAVHWLEFHPENFMADGGAPLDYLMRIGDLYPLSMHGIGLSIGGEGPLSTKHLERLKRLNDLVKPYSVSEHLAWSTHESAFMNDLLPVPFTARTLDRVAGHIDRFQNALERTILLENPSSYLSFEESDIDEISFLEAVSRKTGCGLLLDVNNVYVSAHNMGWSAEDYVDRFPLNLVGEIHLAGHVEQEADDEETLLIDTHDRTVSVDVWSLYERVIDRGGAIPTLIEWDADLPDWSTLENEARKADAILADLEGTDYACAS
ncbi:MAG: DUF692 domain-containing protein [Pseudomonadota bacterium]